MQRINTANKAVDMFGVGKHGFAPSNPAAALQATALSADWHNSLQEEIAGIVEAAGIVLSGVGGAKPGDSITFAAVTQWQVVAGTILQNIASGRFGSSLSGGNWWQMLPSGLIIQMGYGATSASADVAITYPIAFPSQAVAVVPGLYTTGGTTFNGSISTALAGTVNFNVGGYTPNTGARAAFNFFWLAFGK